MKKTVQITAILILMAQIILTTVKSYAQWVNGQAANAVIGQPDFTSGNLATTDVNLNRPRGVIYDATHKKLYVFDQGNNRILRYAVPNSGFKMNQPAAEVVLGQPDMISNSILQPPTARSLYQPISGAIDESKDILWVADGNNRVLGYYNASTKKNGDPADVVLGQPDFNSINRALKANCMSDPTSVAVDDITHDIYVAEWFNNRVLKFTPNNQKNGASADLVFGTPDFTTYSSGVTQNTFSNSCYVYFKNNSLFVVDAPASRQVSRVLRFDNVRNINKNQPNASVVFGYKDFVSSGLLPISASSMRGYIFGLAVDNSNKLYVSDLYNNRVLIFPDAFTNVNGSAAINVLGQQDFVSGKRGTSATDLNSPDGLYIDNQNNILYVVDNWNNRVLQFQQNQQQCVKANLTIGTTSDTVCLGTSATFTATPANGGNNPVYQWKVNGNNVGNNSPTFSTSNLNNGDQVSCVLTSNAQPCVQNNPAVSNTIQMTVLGNPAPTITANGPTTFCQGGSVTLTSSAAPSYLWSTGEKTQSITVKTSGTYTVTVSNNGQCQNSASIVVVVSPSPDINLGPDGTRLIGEVIKANEVNANADVNINPKNYLFFWNPPANTPTYTINTIGSKQYTLNAVQGGCASTSTVNIVSYCKSKGTTKDMSNNVNYIDRVTVGVLDVNNVAQNLINNLSGDNGGYLDYTKTSVIPLTKFKTNIITVYPYTKTASGTSVVYATAWIDYDHNGIFESMDALGLNEQVTLTYSRLSLRVPATVSISNYKVPFGAYNGITRMRIAMKATNDLSPCDNGINPLNGLANNFFGEVEDYTVDIQGNAVYAPIYSSTKEKENSLLNNSATKVTVSPNPFTQKTTLTLNNIQPNKKYTLVITDIYGRRVRQINNITTSTIEINRGNLSAGIYGFKLLDGTNIITTNKMVVE